MAAYSSPAIGRKPQLIRSMKSGWIHDSGPLLAVVFFLWFELFAIVYGSPPVEDSGKAQDFAFKRKISLHSNIKILIPKKTVI